MCISPINIRNPYYYCSTSIIDTHKRILNEMLTYEGVNLSYCRFLQVPCGKCMDCKKQKQNEWYTRLMYHAKLYRKSQCSFVTLTYNNAFLRYAVDESTGELTPTLLKKDAQLFLKRLRKSYGKPITYFLCGEYGSKHHRPHLHLIIFGMSPVDAFRFVPDAWTQRSPVYYDSTTKQINYYPDNLTKKGRPKTRLRNFDTPIGSTYISNKPVCGGSLRYVVKYCTKFTLKGKRPVQEEVDSYKNYLSQLHDDNLTEHYNLLSSLQDGTTQEHEDFFESLFFEDLHEDFSGFQKTFRLCSQGIGKNIVDDIDYPRVVNDPLLGRQTYNTKVVVANERPNEDDYTYNLPRYMRQKLYNDDELFEISKDNLIRSYIRNKNEIKQYETENYQELLKLVPREVQDKHSFVHELATIKVSNTRLSPEVLTDKQRTLLADLFKDYVQDIY